MHFLHVTSYSKCLQDNSQQVRKIFYLCKPKKIKRLVRLLHLPSESTMSQLLGCKVLYIWLHVLLCERCLLLSTFHKTPTIPHVADRMNIIQNPGEPYKVKKVKNTDMTTPILQGHINGSYTRFFLTSYNESSSLQLSTEPHINKISNWDQNVRFFVSCFWDNQRIFRVPNEIPP